MLELIFEDGGESHRIPVRGGLTLGRSSDNDIVLRDFSVSRHHARVDEKDGEFHLVDLDSTNGIRINEEFVPSGVFTIGDLLGVGSFELRVEDATSDTGSFSSATYLRPLSEFNQDYGLEGKPQEISKEIGARERVFEILAQVAKVLIQVEELNPVLEKVMDLVFDHLPVDRSFIVLFDAEGNPQLELNRFRESELGEDAEVPISRTILDMNGAESLLGKGDMLFLPPGTSKLQRIHGAFITEEEIGRIAAFLKNQKKPEYDESVTEAVPDKTAAPGEEEEYDERYDDAVALVTQSGQASMALSQARAASR